MLSSPAVNAGASSRALQPQAQDNEHAHPSSTRQGSLAGRSVIRQEATGESCPHMSKHYVLTILVPTDFTADGAPPPRSIRMMQLREMIKQQEARFVQALASCLQEGVDQCACYKIIKGMCQPVSDAAPAELSWTTQNLIETAKEVYTKLKLESTNDLKPDAEALVKSLSEPIGEKQSTRSWEEIINVAHMSTSPTARMVFCITDSNTKFKQDYPLDDKETAASTKKLENIASAHILHNIAVREFSEAVAKCFEPFLRGEADLNYEQIWNLDLIIKEEVFQKNNPEKYAESKIKYYVKMIEMELKNNKPPCQIGENLERRILEVQSLIFPEWKHDSVIHPITWSKVIGYITSMPRMQHLKNQIIGSADDVVSAIANQGAETLGTR